MHTINRSLSGAAIAVLLAGAVPVAPASAQDSIPDLTGSWSSTPIGGVVLGNLEPAAEARFVRPTATGPYTRTIEAQEGSGFVGTLSGPTGSERMIGVIRPDNETVYFVDEDSYYIGTIVSEDEIEVCILEAGGGEDTMLAACYMFERQ